MTTKKAKELSHAYRALFTAFALLVAVGTANVFSATFVEDSIAGSSFNHLVRQGVIFGIGLIPALFLYKKDYRIWRKYAVHFTVITVILLAAVLAGGIVVNGARRWIGIGMFSFQPSELAKLAGILYTAAYLTPFLEKHKPVEFIYRLHPSRKGNAMWQKLSLVPHIALWGPLLMAGLVIMQPDAGTAIVILAIPIVMVGVGGAHLSKIKIPAVILFVLFIALLIHEPYRLNRIIAWLDPWSYEKSMGYQTVQGLIAIGSGGIFGQGVGEGISKFSYLPEAHTDFAFAVLAQEWGLQGAVLMLVLFCTVIYFGAITAWSCRDTFGMFMALGITLYFGGQGFINIGMVSGLLPVVGVPLPFISYGGTSLIVNMIAAALLLNISKRNYRDALTRETTAVPLAQRSEKKELRGQFPPQS